MKLQVIVGSTRPGRVSDRIAAWVAAEAKKLDGAEVEVVDLADYDLPMFNEAISPQYNPDRQPDEVVKKFIDKLAEADAYAITTPEYNRSISGVLKNALDYVDFQMEKKPVLIVAHGSTGGAQAVSHLRGIIPGLQSFTIPKAVYLIGRGGELFDEIGTLDEETKANPYGPQGAIDAALADLKWYSDALAAART